MEANKTKEEILSKCDGILASVKAYPEDEVLSAMDEYANQLLLEKDRENELLKIDLEIEKKKVLLNYESAISFEKQVKQLQSELQNALRELEAKKSVCNQFTEHIKHLESELSELKEKRKEEIIKAYKDGRISMVSSSSEVAFITPEQYYNIKYVNNIYNPTGENNGQ